MMDDDDLGRHLDSMAAARREVSDNLLSVLSAIPENVAPVAISLGLRDAEKRCDRLSMGRPINPGGVFYEARAIAAYLGCFPVESIERMGQSGEFGFPPPARGENAREWLWSAGEIDLWLDDLKLRDKGA